MAENFGFGKCQNVTETIGILAEREFLQKGTIVDYICSNSLLRSLLALFWQHFEVSFGQKSQNTSFGLFQIFWLPFGSFRILAKIINFSNPLFCFWQKYFRLKSINFSFCSAQRLICALQKEKLKIHMTSTISLFAMHKG